MSHAYATFEWFCACLYSLGEVSYRARPTHFLPGELDDAEVAVPRDRPRALLQHDELHPAGCLENWLFRKVRSDPKGGRPSTPAAVKHDNVKHLHRRKNTG